MRTLELTKALPMTIGRNNKLLRTQSDERICYLAIFWIKYDTILIPIYFNTSKYVIVYNQYPDHNTL